MMGFEIIEKRFTIPPGVFSGKVLNKSYAGDIQYEKKYLHSAPLSCS